MNSSSESTPRTVPPEGSGATLAEVKIATMESRPHGLVVLDERFTITPNPDVFFLWVPKVACSYVMHCVIDALFGDIRKIDAKYYLDVWRAHNLVHAINHESCRANGRDILRSSKSKIITFARNPYDRVVSAYLNKIVSPSPGEIAHFQWIRREILFNSLRNRGQTDVLERFSKGISLEIFVNSIRSTPSAARDMHWAEQYLNNGADVIEPVEIIRFENFQIDFSLAWRKHIGTEFPGKEYFEKNATKRMSPLLTKEIADVLYEIYAVDFEMFGYSRDSWEMY